MLRFTGIPVGSNELARLDLTQNVPVAQLDNQTLELKIAALSNAKGEPPMLGSRDSVEYWVYMMEYAKRKMLQAAALLVAKESEKGK